MKQRAVKFSDEMWEQIQAEAKRSGISAGEFIRSAVEEALDPSEGSEGYAGVKGLRQIVPVAVERPRITTSGLLTAPRFKCPRDCNPIWRPASPKIPCPICAQATVPA